MNLVAQLGSGAVAADWKVDLFEFVGKDDWTNIGDMTGGELYQLIPCCSTSFFLRFGRWWYLKPPLLLEARFRFVDVVLTVCHRAVVPLLK